ncbi:ABC transporter permease [Abyssibius alkaniclasticus]|uniref:ABC transporter permease n=1 Tax=Abyssibius alkaniclasticus TaxID=2881234 RepID=UPI002363EF9A|nr:ABC transporter permease [Abyssibius alkaniclasticus]UPH69836.1 ABC transporter permease [Abyssibius alkaniclasticus]
MSIASNNAPKPAQRAESRFVRWFNRRGWANITISTPYIWLLLFFLLPFIIVIAMSVATRTPTAPPFSFSGERGAINFETYERLFSDTLYIRAFLTSIWNAAIATFLCLIIGYPMALGLTRVSKSWRNILLMLVILPFWTSFLLRVYAWMGMMGSNSWFNKLITSGYNLMVPGDMALRYIPMMNTNFAVILVTVYSYLPFMILPLYANLEKLDITLNEAAHDLGSRPFKVFLDVTLPLSVPGIIAGGLLVFIPASGELIIPTLVGDAGRPMIGRVISDEFASARDWPMASAVAVALLMLLVVPMMLYSYFESKNNSKKAQEE